MNNGIEYEKLTQEIYQGLLKEEGLTTQVRHNVKVKGKSTTHQVDIYWEYAIAGIKHKVAIECKNYNKRISKNIIASFNSILNDIGNTNGIIVTKVGFQKGAKEFANFYGINLVELREPKAEDWQGRLKVLKTNVQTIGFNVKKWSVELDYEWCKANIPEDKLDSIKVVISGMNYEIWVYDDKGEGLKNFQQLQDGLPYDENNLIDNKYVHMFENGYIKSENFGSVKIIGVHMVYDTLVEKFVWVTDSEKITKAILKDVATGDMKFIKK
ncbi:restriction endonuclease [Taibaiella koreensis]|uniref:restriction endonuclease n=1 Tax=Taibaiella koreensis TaxID=1268548 RepID=UPI000E599B06|nr:restriction endonuclease [Taibaiella koreensis]